MQLLNKNDIINPYNSDGSLNSTGKRLFKKGAEMLKKSIKLGVVILSGGEGSRLGINYPKGLFIIHEKTLFEWHLSRIEEIYNKYHSEIYLYIMTSCKTHEKVSEYFVNKNYSFVKKIILFKQNDIETLDMETKQPLKLGLEIVRSPLGNGDIYNSIQNAEHIDEIDAFNVISVDNVLAHVIDEVFVGAFYENKLDVLSKAIEAKENEKVGAFFKSNDKILIKEYSEWNGNSSLSSVANICNHMFSGSYMRSMGNVDLPLHEAFKKVPYTNSEGKIILPSVPNGIKREKFIFDAFEYTSHKKNSVMCVNRENEFSPLKNNLESETDNYKTCLESLQTKRSKISLK